MMCSFFNKNTFTIISNIIFILPSIAPWIKSTISENQSFKIRFLVWLNIKLIFLFGEFNVWFYIPNSFTIFFKFFKFLFIKFFFPKTFFHHMRIKMVIASSFGTAINSILILLYFMFLCPSNPNLLSLTHLQLD